MTPEDTIIFGTPGSGGFDEVPGAQVGPYKLISPLGEGGFGSVWLAERRHPFVQRVALKLVKAGMDSKAVVARFDQERQALAVMNHPGIAKVFDGGLTAQGRPYFAMEYVKGEPITEFCDRVKLSIDERLKLFEQACEAVQHAHLKGIVHRDLKPGNVLAFMVEGEGAKLKVIDFGVAKAMSQRMTEHTIFTETGQMIGTPEYMSPEQADPTGGDIDTRSDIYSLGVLLYELLVGATPFDSKELRKKAYGEIQRTIREQDPPSPSARLSTISTKDREAVSRIESARKLRASDLVRRLRGELEWIPQKAMRKEPQHRYQTAMALAEDVRNYLQGKPIAAAPESSAYRMRKYVRRNRGLVIGVGAVMTALVVGLGVATWQWRVAADQRVVAETARQDAVTAKEAAMASEAKAVEQVEHSNDLLGVIATGGALDAVRRNDLSGARRDLALLKQLGRDERFAARLATAWNDQSISEPLRGHESLSQVSSLAFSPDGKTLAIGSHDKSIRLWDTSTWKAIGEPLRGHEGWIMSIAFSPDGKTLASGSDDETIRLWDVSTWKAIGEPLRRHEGWIMSIAFSPDGKTLASGAGSICLWDTSTWKAIGEPLRGHVSWAYIKSLAFSPDGKTLASGSSGYTIRLWETSTWKVIGEPLRGHENQVRSLAFSPDGKTLASASDGVTLASGSGVSTMFLWDTSTWKAIGEPLRGYAGDGVPSLAFSPDGQTMACANFDSTIRLWDTFTWKAIGEPLRGHDAAVWSVAFSPDGKTLVSQSDDNTIRLWDTSTWMAISEPLRGHGQMVTSLAFSPDGKTLASGSYDNTIRLWDTSTWKAIGEPLRGHDDTVTSVAFSPDGKTLASGSDDYTIRLWEISTWKAIGEPLRGHGDGVTSLAFSPDGKTLASGSAFRTYGKTLASGSNGNTIRLWDTSTWKAIGEPLRAHDHGVTSLAFSPDGKMLASGSEDNTISSWDTSTWKAIGEPLRAHDHKVTSLAFSPDGRTLASGSGDSTIRLWDTSTWKAIGEPLRGHDHGVTSLAFSSDGKTLASGSRHSPICLWDTSTWKAIGEPLRGHNNEVTSLAFSPDGKTLANASADNTIRVWSGVPIREQYLPYRERMNQVSRVRSELVDRIAAVDNSIVAVDAFAAEVRADPRFTGDLRIPALIVVGEVALARQAETDRLVGECKDAYLQNPKDWPLVLQRLAKVAPEDIVWRDYPDFWNEVVCAGLTELPPDSPMRDLKLLLKYAGRAVKISKRADGASLDTLARAHWELGDKGKALDVQREAVTVSAAALETNPGSQGTAIHAQIEARLELYESLPAGAALPKAAAPDTPASTPIP